MSNSNITPRTWAEIDLSALRNNVEVVRELSGGKSIIGVVKANAYGHGAVAIAKALGSFGVERLAVADLTEAIELRDAGIKRPVHVFGPLHPPEVNRAVGLDLVFTVGTAAEAEAISAEARSGGATEKLHLNIDTGMGRLGTSVPDALDVARSIASLPGIELEGAMTHFPSAGELDDDFVLEQVACFKEAVAAIRAAGILLPVLHVANSSGTARRIDGAFDMVRTGFILYGLDCRRGVFASAPTQPVLALKSRVLALQRLPAGSTVGYGRAWRAPKDSLIAVVGIGYADGYMRAYAEKGEMLVRGRRAKVVGRVSMDYTTVDVTDIPGAAVDDEVVLIGSQGKETISSAELAEWSDTISYEVTCWLGRRVLRCYVGDDSSSC